MCPAKAENSPGCGRETSRHFLRNSFLYHPGMTRASSAAVPSPPAPPLRLAVLLSGGGTTLRNLTRSIQAGELRAEIPLVIASRPCRGVELSAELGLRCEVVNRRGCATIDEFSDRIFTLVRQARADLVALSGFLSRVLIPGDFQNRVMNIHPGLIPAFCGQGMHGHHVHEAVLERGAQVSGCTVHFADNEYDHGPIILQRVVPVLGDDTPDTLAARVFAAECEAYPSAIRLFAEGRLQVDGTRVRTLPPGSRGD